MQTPPSEAAGLKVEASDTVVDLGAIPSRLKPPIRVVSVKNEKGVKKIVKDLLNAYGWFTWMPAANGFGAQGVHDHLAIKDGVFLTVEAKFGTNKPSALQNAFAAQVIANDFYSFCVNEKNIDHLAWWLDSFEASKQYKMRGEEIPPEHGSRMLNAMTAMFELWR